MNSLTLALLLTAVAADPCVSGPNVGQRPGPYSFTVATGANRGKSTCYICETADRPAVIVFSRKPSPELGKLLTRLESALNGQPADGLAAWVTVLGEAQSIDELADWAKAQAVRTIPVGNFDDVDGPPTYRLAADAETTVVVFVKQKVTANFALRSGELDDKAMSSILDAVNKIKK